MALPSVDFLNPLPLCLFVLIFKLVEIPSSLSYAPINKKGVRCKDAEMRDIRWNNIYYSTRRVEEILGAARSIVEDACISAPLRTAVKNILISYCFRDQTRKRYNRWKLCRKALALLGECSPLSAAADNGYIIKRREMKKVWSHSAERGVFSACLISLTMPLLYRANVLKLWKQGEKHGKIFSIPDWKVQGIMLYLSYTNSQSTYRTIKD